MTGIVQSVFDDFIHVIAEENIVLQKKDEVFNFGVLKIFTDVYGSIFKALERIKNK